MLVRPCPDETQHRYEEALHISEQAFVLCQAKGDPVGEAWALNAVGWFRGLFGDYARAEADCRSALESHRQSGDMLGEAVTLDSLGYHRHQVGDYATAIALYREAIAAYRQVSDTFHLPQTLAHLGDTYHASGDLEKARSTWQEALAYLTDMHYPDADELKIKLQESSRV
ncbi:MAG TPA: tetratricopeptide repeat protein [Streptosporangiaceae bacterium]|nr:tetratricopeptide repeat protein [Streptosporangiaceae bacterium]